jgi:hypothetical protein
MIITLDQLTNQYSPFTRHTLTSLHTFCQIDLLSVIFLQPHYFIVSFDLETKLVHISSGKNKPKQTNTAMQHKDLSSEHEPSPETNHQNSPGGTLAVHTESSSIAPQRCYQWRG